MRFGLSQALSPRGFGRASNVLLTLLLSTTMAAIAPSPVAAAGPDDPSATQQQPSADTPKADDNQAKQDDKPQPSAPAAAPADASAPSAAPDLCGALATAAAANDLPVDFFTRLIWQESRFKPDAISRAGAQGIAQFMPTTARWRGLENPFNPLDAIAKSGELLRGLRGEFGNLGLAAAAYNAGSARVHDWLGGRRPLPRETRAYVQIVTGRSAEDWAKSESNPVEMPAAEAVPCNLPVTALIPKPDAFPPKPETIKPWGVEVVGAPTPAKALARYHEWKPKYAAIIADREPHVVIRGIIGEMGAARVRVGEDTRDRAAKLCAALRAAGTYCEVLRN
jgi:transglycosylase-like protein with SLT domain